MKYMTVFCNFISKDTVLYEPYKHEDIPLREEHDPPHPLKEKEIII